MRWFINDFRLRFWCFTRVNKKAERFLTWEKWIVCVFSFYVEIFGLFPALIRPSHCSCVSCTIFIANACYCENQKKNEFWKKKIVDWLIFCYFFYSIFWLIIKCKLVLWFSIRYFIITQKFENRFQHSRKNLINIR